LVGSKTTQITVKKIKDEIKKNIKKTELLFVLEIEKQVCDTPKYFSM
jgi:hypothetical protein